ncbi:histone deacetylase 7-like [Zophobas morio]|uniref:histone deacetylase 7-like n=1 Tax=Zophobas morio TaxID=2755281 RepID=UPI003083A64A
MKGRTSEWYQVHFEGWGSEYDEWIRLADLHPRTEKSVFGPLGPESELKWRRIQLYNKEAPEDLRRTGLVYDPCTLRHACTCIDHEANHPETACAFSFLSSLASAEPPSQSSRVASVLQIMEDSELLDRVVGVRGCEAVKAEVSAVHSSSHVESFGGKKYGGAEKQPKDLRRMQCGGSGLATDTVFNGEDTSLASRVAAGCVVSLMFAVVKNVVTNGFAVVRPPGHHAERNKAMGFCVFNNVSVAVRAAQRRLAVKRVLIVDWDVHHGNGTQSIFYDDSSVLFISIHRHDNGTFYPFSGAVGEFGEKAGKGYSVNIPWSDVESAPPGNTEYLAAFHHIVLPIAREFGPELVFVSAGFDAAEGDAIGGCRVTPEGFAHMTALLLSLAGGRVILCLEGGYHNSSLSAGAAACLRVLLGQSPPPLSRDSGHGKAHDYNKPHEKSVSAFHKVIRTHIRYWKCMKNLNDLVANRNKACLKQPQPNNSDPYTNNSSEIGFISNRIDDDCEDGKNNSNSKYNSSNNNKNKDIDSKFEFRVPPCLYEQATFTTNFRQ